jgi:glutamyl-Q tRNA(Asp) synthetase
VAALGSYLDARHHGGRWLVRMEDLDTARVVPGCADQILRTLECFGLTWDGEVEYQSRHRERYLEAIGTLNRQQLTYACVCSRRMRSETEDRGYPGTCRNRHITTEPHALRFRVDDARTVEFDDRFQGHCRMQLGTLGDVVIRRRDGVIAYQLAVVVDDACQQITHVVRGADLLSSTGWQIALQNALGLPTPSYGHLPLVVEPGGAKLSKSARAIPLNPAEAPGQLRHALALLRQELPPHLTGAPPREILAEAIKLWNASAFQLIQRVEA